MNKDDSRFGIIVVGGDDPPTVEVLENISGKWRNGKGIIYVHTKINLHSRPFLPTFCPTKNKQKTVIQLKLMNSSCKT